MSVAPREPSAVTLGEVGGFGSLHYIQVNIIDREGDVIVDELGASDGEKVAIAKGLQAGDQVVIDGVDRLRDGARIRKPAGTLPRASAGPPIANAPPAAQQQQRQRANGGTGGGPGAGTGGASAAQPAQPSQ